MLPIEQARIEMQQGEKEKARAILAKLVNAEPQNSTAWLLIADLLDNPQQASYCHERAESILKNQSQQNIFSNIVERTPAMTIIDENKTYQTKDCYFCAESIPSDTIICPYCKRNLSNQVEQNKYSELRLQPESIASNKGSKRSSYWTNIFLAVLVAIFLVCGFLNIITKSLSPNVRLEVIGSVKSADIAWSIAKGEIESGNYNLPFRKSISLSEGEYVELVAARYDSGSVTCQIWVDNSLWKESTSIGEDTIVFCNGYIGEP
jgi:hypothetical protein